MPDFHVLIDTGKCLATGSCIEEAPETFYFGAREAVYAKDPPENTLNDVINAAKVCPHEAIIVTDAGGSRIWPPE